MLRRSLLVVCALVVALAMGLGSWQLVSQHDTIATLNRSVSGLKTSEANLGAPQSHNTHKLETELSHLLVSVDELKKVVGSASIGTSTVTGAIEALQTVTAGRLLPPGFFAAHGQYVSLIGQVSSLQTELSSLQTELNSLNGRIGSGPATPNISGLLDQVTAVVTCLRQNESNEAAGNC